MPRTPRGPIDDLIGYTIFSLDGPTTPQDDWFDFGNFTVFGVGLIPFGGNFFSQLDWLANLNTNSDLSTFPGDWVSFGFTTPFQQFPEIEIWAGPTEVWVRGFVVNEHNQLEAVGGVLTNEQGVFGADSWNIGGLTSATSGPDLYWSDLHVTNGTEAGETLNGTDGPETLNGLGGDDTINGGAGADALYGGAGDDRLFGGDGIDRLFGGEGNDRIEPGIEQIPQTFSSMHPAADSMIDGGPGYDTLVLDYSSETSVVISADQLFARPGINGMEAVVITGSAYTDVLSGSSFTDVLYGGGGFDVLRGGGGDDYLDAGASGASSVPGFGAGGTSIADALSLDNLFTAGAGAPTVTLSVTDPPGIITDGWGIQQHDPNFFSFTVAEAGAQAFIDWTVDWVGTGGGPSFSFIFTDENGVQIPTSYDSTVPMVFPHAGTYYLEVLLQPTAWDPATISMTFSLEGANVLTSNMLYGGTGNDIYVVYSPTDQVVENPGEGSDLVISASNFTLPANVENLTLGGSSAINGAGNDLANVIAGNSAANVLTGGGSADTLTGGGSADTFRFAALSDSAPETPDMITDFSGKIDLSVNNNGRLIRGLGERDKIDLSAIDANANKAGDQAFTFAAKFTGHAGQLYASYDAQARMTHVYLDVNGDSVADMIIDLSGQVRLSAADFIL